MASHSRPRRGSANSNLSPTKSIRLVNEPPSSNSTIHILSSPPRSTGPRWIFALCFMAVFVMLGLDIYLRMRPIGLPTSFGGEGEAMEKYQDYRELPFVLLGDSITQFGTSPTGWTSRMTCSYVLRLDVLNRGHSGATTNDYVKDAKRIVDAVGKRPNLVTIMLGTNDAEPPESYQHVPLDTYVANLQSMIHDIYEKGRTDRLILITPPPPRASKRPKARFAYRNAMLAVAKNANIPVLDTWSLFLGKYDGSEVDFKLFESLTLQKDYNDTVVARYLIDELHYSGAGNLLHWSGLHHLIRRKYPELAAGEGTDCFR